MHFIKRNFLIIFFSIYFIIGSLNSLKTGISFDEYHEQNNWDYHLRLINNYIDHYIFGKEYSYDIQNEYVVFLGYGIGFQLISQPIQFLLKIILILSETHLDLFGAQLVSKHFVVFVFYIISAIFFYLILKKIIADKFFCNIATIFYCTYPYLFGQAMFSPKDVPFMSVWVICTYLSFNVFEKLVIYKKITFSEVILFSFLTAYLLSIRIAGILIFVQYFISFLLLISLPTINLNKILKAYYLNFLIFIFSLIFFTYIFYPPFWNNPFLLFEAIKVMSNHFNNVGTNTLGEIMYATDLPSTYLLIWFLVKLPALVILGIILLPFTEKKIFTNNKNIVLFGSLLISIFLIPFILIFLGTNLYDEIRQVMFLVPLIIIVAMISFFTFSKFFFYTLAIFSICFFTIESVRINPYQYVWFNLPSRVIDLTKKFELEYQGISGREIAKKISNYEKVDQCILVNPIHTVRPYLAKTNYKCFDIWQKIDTEFSRPFLAVQHVRNLKKGLPYKCNVIDETSFNLFFHKEKFITSKLLSCE